jgi:hypothetical protein
MLINVVLTKNLTKIYSYALLNCIKKSYKIQALVLWKIFKRFKDKAFTV